MSCPDVIKIGKILDSNDFLKYITEAEKLETVVHKYGTPFNIPNYPCWMQYLNEGNTLGSISFSRNTILNPLLNEMTDKIVEIFQSTFSKNFKPDKKRVHLLRTIGSIVKHKDEANRLCCINVGIKNSSVAITKISTDGIRKNFEKNSYDIKLEDGIGYLLNTNQWHSVEGTVETPRYLITYGFQKSFVEIQKLLGI